MEERKRFKIPRQIDASIHIWRFIRLKDIAIMIPPGILSVVLYLWVIPRDWDFQIKFVLAVIPTVAVACLIFIHPIRERKNVILFDVIRNRIRYVKRQKMYYFKKQIH